METTDNKFYQKGQYILFGNPELRNGKIVCLVYNPKALELIIEILNKEEDGILNVL